MAFSSTPKPKSTGFDPLMARMVYQKMNATVMIEAEFIKKKKSRIRENLSLD